MQFLQTEDSPRWHTAFTTSQLLSLTRFRAFQPRPVSKGTHWRETRLWLELTEGGGGGLRRVAVSFRQCCSLWRRRSWVRLAVTNDCKVVEKYAEGERGAALCQWFISKHCWKGEGAGKLFFLVYFFLFKKIIDTLQGHGASANFLVPLCSYFAVFNFFFFSFLNPDFSTNIKMSNSHHKLRFFFSVM